MTTAATPSLGAWIQASRPASNANLVFPLLFGQALAYSITGSFDLFLMVLLLLYGWFDQMFIVFWNDYADRNADPNNKEFNIFSGGSRVLVEGKIQPAQLFQAGLINAILVIGIGLYLTFFYGLVWVLPLFFAGLLLLWAYSMSPLKLNYRGGGEVLQGFGCGVLLPMIGYYVQAGTLDALPWLLLVPFFILHYSSSVATALPDYAADRITVKRTLPVLIGRKNAALAIVIASLAAVLATPLVYADAMASPLLLTALIIVPAAFLVLSLFLAFNVERSPKAIFFFDVCVITAGIFFAIGICLQALA